MRMIKNYIKNFLRNRISNIKFLKKRIYLADQLTNHNLNFNKFVENKYQENFLNFLDIGCFGELPQYLLSLKNYNFYGIDIDKNEIERQKKFYTKKNLNFYNYKIVEPNNLEDIRKNFVDNNFNKDQYTLEKVQAYNHDISNRNLNKNKNFTKENFTEKKINIDNAVKELINSKEINFLKIDIDSNDHEVLYGADKLLSNDKLFGIQIEVDFIKPKGFKFRNFTEVIRYLNHKGYNLHNFISSRYSSEYLPTKYLYSFPGPNENGTPLSGDLVFFKNFDEFFLKKLNFDDCLKLLRLLEIYNQNHIAIELINKTFSIDNLQKNELKTEIIKQYSIDYFGKKLEYRDYFENYKKNKDKFFNII